ncbi:afamin-like [Ornithorhynchus anatinus]|uniref:Albumin domain-containing protein n=1 Tax=Ornithorhynchus anatinus TaxID=9258 RepID=F7B1W2_ORNAN|nr:afamin-like [Ornithorhynchus anatinus]
MKWMRPVFVAVVCLLGATRFLPVNSLSDYLNATNQYIQKNVRSLTTMALAQFLQEASYEDISKMVENLVALKNRCTAQEKLPECSKTEIYLLEDEMCAGKELSEKYGYADCCSQDEKNRHRCFFLRKRVDLGFLLHYDLKPEEECKAYKDDPEAVWNQYIYEIARRQPFLYTPTLLFHAQEYEKVVQACCSEENKLQCFQTKGTLVTNDLRWIHEIHKHLCRIAMGFGKRALRSGKVLYFSQQFPKMELATLLNVMPDLLGEQDGCCEGDVIECFRSRAELVSSMCSNQKAISSQFSNCCDKPVPERGECIFRSVREDAPQDLPPTEEKFIRAQDVCQRYADKKDGFLDEFVYEYSRKHQKVSGPVIRRVLEKYQDLLEKCCQTADPHQCYSRGEEEFQKILQESQARVQEDCAHFQKLGEDLYRQKYAISFTKQAPELPLTELTVHVERKTNDAAHCCMQPDEKQTACIERSANLLYGQICGFFANRSINPGVTNCCKSFAFKEPCFPSLKVDETYTPPAFSPELFTPNEDWCQLPDMELQRKKLKLLINLVKHKPQTPDDQLQTALTDFSDVVKKCCQASGPGACFVAEGPNLIAKLQGS